MIQSAMMFALGAFVSGMVWLAFSVALVRRARRLTERRLLAGVATKRAEFESERDELRARHAVQMYRLEREVGRVLDQATAHRLEADLKEHDLVSLRAELNARDADMTDTQRRLAGERDAIQDLERRHAEAGASLRAVQHQLKLETKRRAIAEEALDGASILADQRRTALTELRLENDALRARLGEPPGAPVAAELAEPHLPRAPIPVEPEPIPEATVEYPAGGSVVPLPTRARQQAAESPEQSAAVVADAARDLQRLAAEDAAPPAPEPKLPAATLPGASNIGELVALRMVPKSPAPEPEPEPDVEEKAETRFFEALAEIRALKRAANQGGE